MKLELDDVLVEDNSFVTVKKRKYLNYFVYQGTLEPSKGQLISEENNGKLSCLLSY